MTQFKNMTLLERKNIVNAFMDGKALEFREEQTGVWKVLSIGDSVVFSGNREYRIRPYVKFGELHIIDKLDLIRSFLEGNVLEIQGLTTDDQLTWQKLQDRTDFVYFHDEFVYRVKPDEP